MNIFDWLKQITTDKKSWDSFTEEQQESFNSYMTHRFVSMYEPYIEVANLGQRIPYPEKEKTYKFYCNMLPKKNVFLKYIKSAKKRPSVDLLQYIAKYYVVSLGEAEDYVYLLKKEGVEHVLENSGLEQKQIKKLLKEVK